MASSNGVYTDFDEILKRGSATEPRNFRPLPKVGINVKEDTDLSLKGAVKTANGWKMNPLEKVVVFTLKMEHRNPVMIIKFENEC